MRIKVILIPEKGLLHLPIHYNHLVQGFIYSNLDTKLARWLHKEGFRYKKRKFKAFTFSRLIGKFNIKDKTIYYKGPISLKIGSPYSRVLESLAENFIKSPFLELASQRCHLKAIEVERPLPKINTAIIKMLSPLVIYSTLYGGGKKKTYYYTPWEKEFSEKIMDNLKRKWIAFYQREIDTPLNGAYIKLEKVNNRNLSIVMFKETVIKGWTGIYKLHLPEPFFSFAYDIGLGSKNSQGFGMFDIIE